MMSVTKIAGQTETNVGANLMFALQRITGIKPMSGNVWVLIIGSFLFIVRSANIRFTPT